MRLDRSVERQIDQIRLDRRSGAAGLSRRAVRIAESAIKKFHSSDPRSLLLYAARVCRLLALSRPSMAALPNVMAVFFVRMLDASRDEISPKKIAATVAEDLIRELDIATESIAAWAQSIIPTRGVLMTHSYSSTVLAIIKSAKPARVIASESRPLLEGRRLALKLSSMGVPTTLITDAAMGYHVSEADLVLVGADAILPDGSVVNKIGTSLLALVARENKVPFWVASETLKFSIRKSTTILEEMDPAEVASSSRRNLRVRNYYFDVTPRKFVNGIVTELGLFSPNRVSRYAHQLERYISLLDRYPRIEGKPLR